MPYREYTISTSDGISLFAREWKPDGEIRGAVGLVHGLGEHSRRYRHVAEYFASNGYTLAAFDLRGHGKSWGKRGHIPTYGALLKDIGQFTLHLRREYAGLPLFVYGHSMGGNAVINFILREKPAITGSIVTSPWLKLANPPARPLISLLSVVNVLFPSLTQPNGLDSSDLTRDPKVSEKYDEDPLVHNKISIRTVVELSKAGAWALEHACRLSVPMLLMHGTTDRITSFDASRAFAAEAQQYCTFQSWKGLRHELHNEPEKQKVLKAVMDWIKEKSKSQDSF